MGIYSGLGVYSELGVYSGLWVYSGWGILCARVHSVLQRDTGLAVYSRMVILT